MEVGGSSKNKNRRIWTREEEEALLTILDDVVGRGQRCDTGAFKSGTLNIIEAQLAEKCPQSNLRVNPHIESKLKIWKKQYSIVYDMLNKSGFGWNDSKKCVEIDSDEAWTAYVQSNKSAEGWRDRSFPLYDRLGNIFRRDRAIGSGAQTARQMTDDSNINTDYEPHIDWGAPDSPFTPMSVNQNLESDAPMSSHSIGRKRARTKAKDNMADQFSEVGSNLINKLSEKLDQGESNYPKYLAEELKILGFSTTQNVKIGLAMRSNPTFVEVFKVIDNDDKRIEFAKSFLDN